MHFVSCKSRNDCCYNETHCLSCGRSIEEINTVRVLTSSLATQISEVIHFLDNDNGGEFVDFVLKKTGKKLK